MWKEYIPYDTVVTSDICNSGNSENNEKNWHFRIRAWNSFTKWYTKLCNLVGPFLRNCVTTSNFQYFLNKGQKKALAIKGLCEKKTKSYFRSVCSPLSGFAVSYNYPISNFIFHLWFRLENVFLSSVMTLKKH